MKKQFRQAAAIAAAVLMIGAGSAWAQQTSDQPKTAQPPSGTHARTRADRAKATSGADQSFIKKAAQGGMAEVELGRLATQKASSDQVKQFGQKMVDDHGKANDQLKSIAEQEKMPMPAALTAKDRHEYDRLSKLSGDQFDRAYMQLMVRDHRKDVGEFRKESQSAKDDQVKQFASSTLPTLEDHLKLAESAAQAVGAGTRATSGTSSTRRPKGTTGTGTKSGTSSK